MLVDFHKVSDSFILCFKSTIQGFVIKIIFHVYIKLECEKH